MHTLYSFKLKDHLGLLPKRFRGMQNYLILQITLKKHKNNFILNKILHISSHVLH